MVSEVPVPWSRRLCDMPLSSLLSCDIVAESCFLLFSASSGLCLLLLTLNEHPLSKHSILVHLI